MSQFVVGDRVRAVLPLSPEQYGVGDTGTVIKSEEFGACRVVFDHWLRDVRPGFRHGVIVLASELQLLYSAPPDPIRVYHVYRVVLPDRKVLATEFLTAADAREAVEQWAQEPKYLGTAETFQILEVVRQTHVKAKVTLEDVDAGN